VPQTLAIAVGAALIVVIDYRLLLLGMAVLCFAGAALLVGQRRPALVEATSVDPAESGLEHVPRAANHRRDH